jgi:predicted phage terminase large subunit-like protein
MALIDFNRLSEKERELAYEQLQAVLAKRRLKEFVRFAWNWIEPRAFRDNWHIDVICEHLEAINRGEIDRLLINIPPRHGKSLIFSVFWPVWTWLQENIEIDGEDIPTCGPGTRFLFASYSERLSIRDSLRCRNVIRHPVFRRNYDLQISPDQDQKIRFDIVGGGYRVATSVNGLATGEGGDIIGVDDPHNVKKAESEAVREETVRWFAEVLPSRFNDQRYGALAVIMQRVHERDVSGYILSEGLGYTHLCLPARYEKNHPFPCKADRRTKEGELLWMSEAELQKIEKPLGKYACTPYESPVLMADLSLKPIGEVRVGDEVIGFAPRPRTQGAAYERLMLKPAQVLAVHKYHAPVVKMTLDSGEVIRCTADHKWYKKARSDGNWYSPAVVGTPLCRICPPRLPDLSLGDERLAGWLGGFFDGEGSVSLSKKPEARWKQSPRITFYQGSGRNAPLCRKLETALEHFGFDFSFSEDERKPNKDAPCYGYRAYTLRGPCLPLMQRFLHIAKPVKWRDRIIDGAYGSKFITGHERVVSIEPDGEEFVYALETTTGNYVVWGLASSNSAGQLQQRPAPREGGLFQRHWFQIVTHLPERRIRVRSWDIAGSIADYDPDYTVGVLMSKCDQGYYWIEDVVRFRATSLQVDREQRACAMLDGVRTRITVPQDPGSAGKHHAEHMVRNLAGFIVKVIRPTGDKETRAKAFAAQAEAGNVRLLKAPWNNEFLNELCSFPNGRYDDQVDAASDAFNELAETQKTVGSRPMIW